MEILLLSTNPWNIRTSLLQRLDKDLGTALQVLTYITERGVLWLAEGSRCCATGRGGISECLAMWGRLLLSNCRDTQSMSGCLLTWAALSVNGYPRSSNTACPTLTAWAPCSGHQDTKPGKTTPTWACMLDRAPKYLCWLSNSRVIIPSLNISWPSSFLIGTGQNEKPLVTFGFSTKQCVLPGSSHPFHQC